jgi:hypothetical protein
MRIKGKKVFTGKMQIANGWEFRPFAVQVTEGAYAPGLPAREHRAGCSEGKVITLEPICVNKEEAFEIALSQCHQLACGR